MKTLDVVVNVIVIVSLIYVTFALTLRDWLLALRRGQAVTLLPEGRGRTWPFWTQVGMTVLGLLLCVPLFYFLWIPLVRLNGASRWITQVLGLVLFLAGCAFMLWARQTLGRMWGISTSRNVKLLENHQLIQGGPYRYVRHPMYFGWWVAMFGLLIIYPTWVVLLFLLFSVFAFIGRARREEAALAERFGEAWKSYAACRKFLIPFIY